MYAIASPVIKSILLSNCNFEYNSVTLFFSSNWPVTIPALLATPIWGFAPNSDFTTVFSIIYDGIEDDAT